MKKIDKMERYLVKHKIPKMKQNIKNLNMLTIKEIEILIPSTSSHYPSQKVLKECF